MDSDIHNTHHNQQQQQQQNLNTGLTRYRSAPSSYFSNLINNGAVYGDEDLDPFFNSRISSPETERILSRFISSADNHSQGNEFMKQEQVNFSSQGQQQQQMMYQNHVQSRELVRNNNSVDSSSNSSSAVVDRLRPMDPPMNLLRQSSSPAGFFEHINIDNGYHMMRSMDKFQPANGSVPDSSFSTTNRLKSPLARIPENEGKPMMRNNGGFGETHTKVSGYASGFPGGSWDESSMLNDGFLNEFLESDQASSSENHEKWRDEGRIRSGQAPTGLAHQLSLPTSSTELSALQFQDNVPLRSRAKRGCATHPRSIAERVRRTRISERMRKLQDLVPNMDKQTSTADMLDLAVDYIKDLQNQVETLADRRTKCTCSDKLKT